MLEALCLIYVLECTDLQEFSSRLFIFPVIYNMVTNIICVNTILTDLMLAIEEVEVSDFLRVSMYESPVLSVLHSVSPGSSKVVMGLFSIA